MHRKTDGTDEYDIFFPLLFFSSPYISAYTPPSTSWRQALLIIHYFLARWENREKLEFDDFEEKALGAYDGEKRERGDDVIAFEKVFKRRTSTAALISTPLHVLADLPSFFLYPLTLVFYAAAAHNP